MQIVTDDKNMATIGGSSLLTRIRINKGAALRSGTRLISGFMPAGALIPDAFEVPYFDTRTRRGYQRLPQEARINQLATDLRRGRTDLPTAVLLNIRGKDAKLSIEDDHLDFSVLKKHSLKFHVVDGQHRILALRKLLAEPTEPEGKWDMFAIPFVCLVGADEKEEMEQFYIVNSTAKSVKTDLALSLLRTRAEADPDVRVALQERGREWQVDGQGLVEKLAAESPLWKHRVRLPSMEKGETTISSASLVESLKPLLTSGFFGNLKAPQQIRILEAYWEAIRNVLRPAFDNPTAFSVQKGVGVMVLHNILLHVLEVARSKGLLVTEPDSYAEVLGTSLSSLEGEDANGEPVSGVEFWASAAEGGAAGSYSSSAGRRVLVAKIRQLLPAVELD